MKRVRLTSKCRRLLSGTCWLFPGIYWHTNPSHVIPFCSTNCVLDILQQRQTFASLKTLSYLFFKTSMSASHYKPSLSLDRILDLALFEAKSLSARLPVTNSLGITLKVDIFYPWIIDKPSKTLNAAIDLATELRAFLLGMDTRAF